MDNRKFHMGAIWRVPDKKINFPNNLFRTSHKERVVVIIENSDMNFDKKENLILIAPLSTQILQHHKLDIFIKPDEINRLDKECYIRMRAIQFIPKSLCKKYVGKMNNNIKYDILTTLKLYINNGQDN